MLRYPAAERNKEPILNVLKQILSSDHKIRALEIGLSFKFISNLSKSFRIWCLKVFYISLKVDQKVIVIKSI